MAPKKASKRIDELPEKDTISDTNAAGVIHKIKSWDAVAKKMKGELSFSDDEDENHLRHQLKIREEFEERRTEISNIKAVNMSEIEKWMIGPSSKLERIKSTRESIVNQLPGLQRNFFSFEANEVPQVPKALVNFLERHIRATEADKESSLPQN
jgi:hypothetical protein